MGLGRTLCAALVGLDGHVVEVEAHVAPGLVCWVVVGLPDAGVLEARDRVRSALVASRQAPPQARVTVNLSPAGLSKSGTAFDLGVAISVLAAVGQVPGSVAGVGHVGELGLDGAVRAVPGVLPAVLGLRRAGVRQVVVPAANAEEARLVPGLRVHGVRCLAEAVALHRGEPWPVPGGDGAGGGTGGGGDTGASTAAAVPRGAPPPAVGDLSDVVGQPMGRRAVEVVAAGPHHLLMLGPPGAGKTMLAARLPGLLPDLGDEDALTATAVHSLAGTLAVPQLIRRPPFESPHHTASVSAVVGGGTGLPRPGAASRAHAGVLFLDECPEFRRGVLDALRQPLEQGVVEVHRSRGVARLPARFQLVLAANPCPCGKASAGSRGAACSCTPMARRSYLARLSGPLLDRVDLQVDVPAVTAARWAQAELGEPTAVVAARVVAARGAAGRRWGAAAPTNAQVPGSLLRSRPHRPAARVLAPLVDGVDRGTLTARGFDRALRVAWTLADLAGRGSPGPDEIAEAVAFRTLAAAS
ncbi:YifB family Mg chelatase-like AAA ATPase [Aquipuribacter sp. MA13-6]|uniref:YifB family Mg chelatase-like AAA ATPase n=1 Tax=Aquipuribacter sp. MA13-6 TaxID=3440839 RepID=UPI003EEACE4C